MEDEAEEMKFEKRLAEVSQELGLYFNFFLRHHLRVMAQRYGSHSKMNFYGEKSKNKLIFHNCKNLGEKFKKMKKSRLKNFFSRSITVEENPNVTEVLYEQPHPLY